MSKPPSKGETPPPAKARLQGGKIYLTRATAAATSSSLKPSLNTRTPTESPAPKEPQGPPGQLNVTERAHPSGDVNPMLPPLANIANFINFIITKENLSKSAKASLEGILTYILEANEKEGTRLAKLAAAAEESAIRKSIRADLDRMYGAITVQLNDIQNTSNATLSSSSKLIKDTECVAAATKDLTGKVGKITDTADRIATDTSKYRDAVLSRPAQTLRTIADPKVLADIERKARQILVEMPVTDGKATLSKSLSELTIKANEVISAFVDSGKPKDAKVDSLLKTRRGDLLLVLNSKEAVSWISEPDIEIAFTKAFEEGSIIKARTYNLIVPRVPISFDPKDDKHIRELEESNGLRAKEIFKAKWIKPIERRRPDQTHAFVILTLFEVDSANRLIRDGLNICNARVRPTKQKLEPVQCMKCRKWGHFVSECLADKDTCGSCGDAHRTNACTNKGKVYCVSCGDRSHPSWDRTCPEFSRRCAIRDERNPENAMPFFPTAHDWTLTARPHRVPLDERFPGKYAVNSLPTAASQRPTKDLRPPRKDRRGKENPNYIPINRNREVGDLSRADENRDPEHDGLVGNWHGTDEDNLNHKHTEC